MHHGYVSSAEQLRDRIAALIPSHPEIMTCDGPFAIFKIAPDFKCDDLQPSLAQASWALSAAREMHRNKQQS